MKDGLRQLFADLHREGTFLMPNAWDIGSAKLLASLGFPAVATTSAGLGAALGRMDQEVSLDELVVHVRDLVAAVKIPINVDAENGYAATPQGVAETVDRLAAEGAAGLSIEDYDPSSGIYPLDVAIDRVAAAVEAAKRHGVVLTARAENYLYDIDDIDDTIARLRAFREVGADVLYAPRIEDHKKIARLVAEVDGPLNVLLMRTTPTVDQLADIGVRRISTGGALALTAYGALASAARELLTSGTSTFAAAALTNEDRVAAFGADA